MGHYRQAEVSDQGRTLLEPCLSCCTLTAITSPQSSRLWQAVGGDCLEYPGLARGRENIASECSRASGRALCVK